MMLLDEPFPEEPDYDIAPTCPCCDDTGSVDVRHPELDDVSPSGQAWMWEWCDCVAGQQALDAYLAQEVEW